jgi:methionyl-tRNA synthetase
MSKSLGNVLDPIEIVDRAELTPALELVWERVRRLNRYVEETTPWALAKDPANDGRLDVVLATLVEGVRVVAVLLAPVLPETVEKLLGALGAPDIAYAGATLTAGAVTQVQALAPLFPKDIPAAA